MCIRDRLATALMTAAFAETPATPTMKIKRNRIENHVSSQVPTWYGNNAKVQWA